jgi:hypothetical protein
VVDLFNKEVGASISYESNIDKAMVFADRNKLVSVFNNLIKNATQSIPEGREGKVVVKVLQQHNTIQVSVSDNGSGIEEEAYEKVFVPNFTTKTSGTGLGLAITKQIIDSANGKIWFETELDRGTTFFVTLPCHV